MVTVRVEVLVPVPQVLEQELQAAHALQAQFLSQEPRLQATVSLDWEDMQSVPPFWAGVRILRVRVMVPGPQGTLQVL